MLLDPIPALKQQLAAELVEAIRDMPPWNAAVLIGTDQPRISDLRRGRLERFSLERLVRFLSRVRRRVELRVIAEPRFARGASSGVAQR